MRQTGGNRAIAAEANAFGGSIVSCRMRPIFDALAQGLKYAIRGIRRSPAFAAAVVLTLGLGIGANVAMFGVVDRLMFRPFAYLKDPDSAHRVYLQHLVRGVLRTDPGDGYTRYQDLQRWTTSFSHYAGFAYNTMAVGLGEGSREMRVGQVSASFFDFFDARPALGRFFTPAEDTTPRGADVAVLGYAFWQSEFGGRNVLGKVLQVGNIPATIIGVVPEGFAGVLDDSPPALYIPVTTFAGAYMLARGWNPSSYYTEYDWGWMSVMVRRKPGVSVDQANADVTQAYRRSWEAEREQDQGQAPVEIAKPRAVVSSLRLGAGPSPSLEARTALWVTGVAAIVLLIACANVANLFLARAIRRQRETAVRLALGVSRGRLLMHSLMETLVLALIGSAAGMLIAQWGGAAVRRLLISSQGASLDVFTDWRSLGVAVGVALIAAILTGLAPLALSGRGDPATALKSGSRAGTSQRSRARVALLVAQGALSVVLLVGAALFVKSLYRVKSMPMGYDLDQVLHVTRNLRGTQLDDSATVRLRERLVARAQEIPTVAQAAFVASVPFSSTSSTSLFVPGIDSVHRLGNFSYQTTTTDYFKVMGTRILRGRGFTALDHVQSPPVAVVSEGMARVLWPRRDALGQCMRVRSETAPCTTVVGIAEDIVQRDLSSDQRYHYYLLLDQFRPASGNFMLLKMRGDPASQGEAVRKALQPVMPGQGYIVVRPMREILDEQYRSWRLGATMFLAFGILALIVAAVGLYGVIGYNVTQRMHELGVRVALGAQRGDILRLVVGQGVRFAVAGIVLGSLLALLIGGWLQPLLFKQSARDPIVYAAVGLLLLLVALVATALPAVRATRADPNASLRSD
jgi:putative ABC transport system permease protein